MAENIESRGRGRPALGEDAKTETARVRMTVAEKRALQASADAQGMTLSEYIRDALRLN